MREFIYFYQKVPDDHLDSMDIV